MKAENLEKRPIQIDVLYKQIERKNESGCFKHGVAGCLFVSDEMKFKLIEDGFKLSYGHYDNLGEVGYGMIIEW